MEKTNDVWVYSQLLKKPFATLDELKKAEDEYNKAHAAEIKAAEDRKARAKQIEDAYKDFLEARKHAKEILDEANRKASDLIKVSEDKYLKLKDDFIKDYHSFHMSYSNTDGVSVSDLFDAMFNSPFWF